MASVFKKCDCEARNAERKADGERLEKCEHKWTVRYRDDRGKQREKSFLLKGSADKFSSKVEHQKDVGTYIDPKLFKRPVTDIFQEWMTGGDRERVTRDGYGYTFRIAVEPFWSGRSIGAVQPKDIDEWCEWMRTELNYAESTAYQRYTVLSSVFNFAHARRYISWNPFPAARGVSRAKAQKETKGSIQIPTIEEIVALAESVRSEYRGMVWVMAGTGVRIGEAAAISVDCIDFKGKMIAINRQVARDGRGTELGGTRIHLRNLKHRGEEHRRDIPLPDFVALELRRHIHANGLWRDEFLFPNISRTNHLDRSSWARLLVEATGDANLGRQVKGHWLRHYFASVCLADGVPVNDLAEWLGHASPEVVQRTYAHLMPDAPERTRTALDRAFAAALAPSIKNTKAS